MPAVHRQRPASLLHVLEGTRSHISKYVHSEYVHPVLTPWLCQYERPSMQAISPWLNQRTLDKIQLHSGGPSQTEALLDFIPAENLPEFLGGACQCGGGCIPEPGADNTDDDVVKVNLAAGAVHEVKTVASGAGQAVAWEFWTPKHDVSFECIFEPADGTAPIIVVAKEK